VITGVFAGTGGARHIFIDDEAICGKQGGLVTSGEIIDWAFSICEKCLREWAARRERERAA
jgi:hypothetical protein